MKLLRTYPDVERLVVDELSVWLDDCTVGVGMPDAWTVESDPHVQVNVDGSSTVHPITATSTVRLTVWAQSTTTAKELVQRAAVHLMHSPGDKIGSVRPGAGMIPARDDDHSAELASLTVLVRTRSTELGS